MQQEGPWVGCGDFSKLGSRIHTNLFPVFFVSYDQSFGLLSYDLNQARLAARERTVDGFPENIIPFVRVYVLAPN
jgi:hypothetical protein